MYGQNQDFTSGSTSINSDKLPAVYNNRRFLELVEDLKTCCGGPNIIDIGGGKYDNAVEHMWEHHCAEVSVFDPFNRSKEHNDKVLAPGSNYYDLAVCSNVLNVINTAEGRYDVLKLCRLTAPVTVITVYEGDRSGTGRQTGTDSWQENRKLASYVAECERVFENVSRKYGCIVCW